MAMTATEWKERIQRGQEEALRKYGHLTPDEIREKGRRGLIPRPTAEFLIAHAAGRANRVSG